MYVHIFLGGQNLGSSLRPTEQHQTHQGGTNSPGDSPLFVLSYLFKIKAANEKQFNFSENFIYEEKCYYSNLLKLPLEQRVLDPSGNPIPDEYDPGRLPLLGRHQVTFWDETHPKVVISTGKIKTLQNKKVEVKNTFLSTNIWYSTWLKKTNKSKTSH